jgi:AcrR family transcriptional regulator
MKIAPDRLSSARPYRQRARAEAADETARRIVAAFGDAMRHHWFDEITLDDVARRAGVTPRTIIRRFGSKEGLLAAFVDDFVPSVRISREASPGEAPLAVAQIAAIYEDWGDSIIRNLAQEERHPALKRLLDQGRENHRAITSRVFSPWLDRIAGEHRTALLDALVLATDVYAWKLLRRDMGRSAEETLLLMRRLVDAVLAQVPARASDPGDPT